LIEHVYESDPPAYLDFGEGEGDYKKQLANDIVHTVSLLLTRRSAGMTALLGTHRFVVRLDSELRNLVRKTALGRRLKRSRRSAGQPHV
jgi:CelD/BcsL family acetyltransferase involved in cellulose biosynthesis